MVRTDSQAKASIAGSDLEVEQPMAKYRKKPVVIEAVQFDGTNCDAVEAFIGKPIEWKTSSPPIGCIETLEGVMKARAGDYIIRGVQGEFYPCKPDIFEATYELVED